MSQHYNKPTGGNATVNQNPMSVALAACLPWYARALWGRELEDPDTSLHIHAHSTRAFDEKGWQIGW